MSSSKKAMDGGCMHLNRLAVGPTLPNYLGGGAPTKQAQGEGHEQTNRPAGVAHAWKQALERGAHALKQAWGGGHAHKNRPVVGHTYPNNPGGVPCTPK